VNTTNVEKSIAKSKLLGQFIIYEMTKIDSQYRNNKRYILAKLF